MLRFQWAVAEEGLGHSVRLPCRDAAVVAEHETVGTRLAAATGVVIDEHIERRRVEIDGMALGRDGRQLEAVGSFDPASGG